MTTAPDSTGAARTSGRSRIKRPYRRLRRWYRNTPTPQVLTTLAALVVALALVAAGLVYALA